EETRNEPTRDRRGERAHETSRERRDWRPFRSRDPDALRRKRRKAADVISVKVRHHHPIEIVGPQPALGEQRDERLLRRDVESRPGHAAGRAGLAARVDENALVVRLEDPRPHRQWPRERRIAGELPDQSERSTVRGTALEEGGLELQGAGGEGGD